MDKKLNVLAVAVAIAVWFALGAGAALATVHCVNTGNVTCQPCDDPTPYTSIQAAIDASQPGDTVCVAAGTYDEQVSITIPLTLQGEAPMASFIQPTSVTANTTSIINASTPIAAIVLVNGTTGVSVSEFTVNGFFAVGCSTTLVGIFYRASSGAIENNHVTNIAKDCPNALGIFVQTDKTGKTKADVAINNNVVDTYGKNGITANESGTFVTVHGNMITGNSVFTSAGCVPPKIDIAQNGVQIGYGARGIVTGNTPIANHCYDPPDFVACGVLFFKSGGGPGRAKDNLFIANEGNVCNASGAIGSAFSPFNE